MKKIIYLLIVIIILSGGMNVNAFTEPDYITRSELADMSMELKEYVTQTFIMPTSENGYPFSDISDSKYAYRIFQAYASNYMYGMGEGAFFPERYVTKNEAIVVMYRVLNSLNEEYGVTQDLCQMEINPEGVKDWSINEVSYMILSGIIPNTGNFDDLMERNEIIDTIEDIKKIFAMRDMPVFAPDVPN